jgi:hypothetical protein
MTFTTMLRRQELRESRMLTNNTPEPVSEPLSLDEAVEIARTLDGLDLLDWLALTFREDFVPANEQHRSTEWLSLLGIASRGQEATV